MQSSYSALSYWFVVVENSGQHIICSKTLKVLITVNDTRDWMCIFDIGLDYTPDMTSNTKPSPNHIENKHLTLLLLPNHAQDRNSFDAGSLVNFQEVVVDRLVHQVSHWFLCAGIDHIYTFFSDSWSKHPYMYNRIHIRICMWYEYIRCIFEQQPHTWNTLLIFPCWSIRTWPCLIQLQWSLVCLTVQRINCILYTPVP